MGSFHTNGKRDAASSACAFEESHYTRLYGVLQASWLHSSDWLHVRYCLQTVLVNAVATSVHWRSLRAYALEHSDAVGHDVEGKSDVCCLLLGSR